MLVSATALVDVRGLGAVAVCHSSAAQPFAFSSANSNMFVFGGNAQSAVASSAPWNVQVVFMSVLRIVNIGIAGDGCYISDICAVSVSVSPLLLLRSNGSNINDTSSLPVNTCDAFVPEVSK